MNSTELQHWGVKGMKWGVRRKNGTNTKNDRATAKNRKAKGNRAVKTSLALIGGAAIASAGIIALSRAGKAMTETMNLAKTGVSELLDLM